MDNSNNLTPAELAQVEAAKAALPKATPGKWWACCKAPDAHAHFVFADGGEACICHLTQNDPDDDYDPYDPMEAEVTRSERQANAALLEAAPVLTRRVIELEEQLRRYEWSLAETEALVMSHEGHIAKQDAEIKRLKDWQERASPWINDTRAYVQNVVDDLARDGESSGLHNAELDNLTALITEAQGGEGR